MCRITDHPKRGEIEKIILEHRFRGEGSTLIQAALIKIVGFEATRQSIDEYYKKNLNGEFLSQLIANAKKEAIQGIEGDNGIESRQIPSFCEKTANSCLVSLVGGDFGVELREHKIEICKIYSEIVGLVAGNVAAHKEGKERLKVEYIKFICDLRMSQITEM